MAQMHACALAQQKNSLEDMAKKNIDALEQRAAAHFDGVVKSFQVEKMQAVENAKREVAELCKKCGPTLDRCCANGTAILAKLAVACSISMQGLPSHRPSMIGVNMQRNRARKCEPAFAPAFTAIAAG